MRRTLAICFIVVTAWLLHAPALLACSCAFRGPTCKWFPSSTDPAFVGRIVEMQPGETEMDFQRTLQTLLAPYTGASGNVYPGALEGPAFQAYLNAYRDRWIHTITPEADRALGGISSYEQFEAWIKQFPADRSRRRILFAVSELFAGEVGETVEVWTGVWGGGADCTPHFSVGEEYLVFAGDYQGQLRTSTCSGTRHVSRAQPDLEYLRGFANAAPVGSLIGQAFKPVWNEAEGRRDPRLAAGAEITARSSDGAWSAIADSNGIFEIGALPAGQYSVSGDFEGETLNAIVIPGEAPVFTVAPRSCDFVRLSADLEAGTIVGRLFDYRSEPSPRLSVQLVPVRENRQIKTTQTDNEGRFKFDELQPGSYLVGINVVYPPTARQPYEPIYYPGVPTKQLAQIFRVDGDEPVDTGPLKLGPPLRTRLIRARFVLPEGVALRQIRVNLLRPGTEDPVGSLDQYRDGEMSGEALAGHAYTLLASQYDSATGRNYEGKSEVAADGDVDVTVVLTLKDAP